MLVSADKNLPATLFRHSSFEDFANVNSSSNSSFIELRKALISIKVLVPAFLRRVRVEGLRAEYVRQGSLEVRKQRKRVDGAHRTAS